MTFVDMEITRRHFAARYLNVGRAMLGTLADIYGLDIDVAVNWADAIDRETDDQIAAGGRGSCPLVAKRGEVADPASPSTLSHDAALYPKASQGGVETSGAACTAAPGFSPSYPVGSRRGSVAAVVPPDTAAAEQIHRA